MSSHISFNITLSLALFRTVRWNIFSFLNENIDTCADLVYFLSDFAELCVCNHRYVHVCLVQWCSPGKDSQNSVVCVQAAPAL